MSCWKELKKKNTKGETNIEIYKFTNTYIKDFDNVNITKIKLYK